MDTVIQGRYFSDILDQPRAIEATWESLRNSDALADVRRLLTANKFERLVLTGMGSSFFALHPLALETAEHGWSPLLIETSELIHYYPLLLNATTLVVAVSQSGQSAETLRLLERNGSGQTVIAVTNTPESPLAKNANVALLTNAGDEFSVSCKTYVAGLSALSLLSAALCAKDIDERFGELEPAAGAAASYLHDWNAHVEQLVATLRGARHLFLVGRGASLAAVGTGALIIKESDHFHAEGMSSAAFRHGPFEMLSAETVVGVFSGDERTRKLNERMATEIREHGAQSLLIGSDSPQSACRIPKIGNAARPMLEILPVQMMTLALAAIAGREAGKFDRATKVTVVE